MTRWRKSGLSRLAALSLAVAALAVTAQESDDFDRFYAGAGAALVLPQGGADMKRVGGATLRGGCYLTEDWALEGSVSWLENRIGFAAGALWHWHGCEEFDKLFGYERFDPFFTFGAKGWTDDGDVGPYAGLGALYYLSEEWALRGDLDVTLGLERGVEADWSFSLGFQYSF